MKVRWLLIFVLTLPFLSAEGSDILADEFGVRFGCLMDEVIDRSYLSTEEENGFVRYKLNGCKFLYQKSCRGFIVDEFYSSKENGRIEGFSATKRVSGRQEAEIHKSWLLKEVTGIKSFCGENGINYYCYTNDRNEKRIVFLRLLDKDGMALSIIVYSLDLLEQIERQKQSKFEESCVTISTDTGSQGSGALIEEDGVLYLYTNRHVIEPGVKVLVKSRNGTEFSLGNLQVSRTQDLARFRVNATCGGLKLDKEIPRIGDSVIVLGNSMGAGAITQAKGKVVGVGSDVVEVDADFVRGNSGGPIINQQGRVIGIATFATKAADEVDWVVKGTRYEKARRFGLRPFATDWENISLELLNKQYSSIVDCAISVVLFSVTPFVLGNEYPLKRLEVDFSKLNATGISVEALKRYKRLVSYYNSLQQWLLERQKIEHRLVKYLSVSGDISIPCRRSKHGDEQSVLYKIDDGFEGIVREFCVKHSIRTEKGSTTQGLLDELIVVQEKLVSSHREYQKTMDRELRDTKNKLLMATKGLCYADEARQLIDLLERFKDLARDNKYK